MGVDEHSGADGIGKFKITANNKCIACNECSRNCQVGIDVMRFALKQEPINNVNSSCIGCGVCVSVCPMDVLGFGKYTNGTKKLKKHILVTPADKINSSQLPSENGIQ